MRETPSDDYARRTEWNVRDSDATLILSRGELAGGTALALELAEALEKTCLALDLAQAPDPLEAAAWIRRAAPAALNVAGPRESEAPGIHSQAKAFLEHVFSHLAGKPPSA